MKEHKKKRLCLETRHELKVRASKKDHEKIKLKVKNSGKSQSQFLIDCALCPKEDIFHVVLTSEMTNDVREAVKLRSEVKKLRKSIDNLTHNPEYIDFYAVKNIENTLVILDKLTQLLLEKICAQANYETVGDSTKEGE
jgi:hypothetical protein